MELLNRSGFRVPGFTRDDAVPIDSDGLRHTVRWQERTLAELPAGEYHIRLHLEEAEVYAITLATK